VNCGFACFTDASAGWDEWQDPATSAWRASFDGVERKVSLPLT